MNIGFYKQEIASKGLKYFLKARTLKSVDYFTFLKARLLHRRFYLNGTSYEYLISKYNSTWKNERAIEVPLIYNEVLKCKNEKVLEIGNVLSHYYNIKHDVLDKYEKAKGVINKDVVTYKTKIKYDLIVAISTLEHVGWDEKQKEETKILKAIQNLKTLLTKNGKIIITIPIGYNPYLDKIIETNKIKFKHAVYLKRRNNANLWSKTKYQEIKNAKYNYPFPNANAIIFAEI